MNLTKGIILFICAIALISCQKEDDFTQFQEVKLNTDQHTISAKNGNREEICIAYGIPDGYRVIDLVYRPYCPSQGPDFTPNTAIIEKENRTPRIFRAGAGCNDNYCIWIVGENFEPNAYIDIRTTTGETIIGTYRGADRQINISPNGDDTMSIRLRTSFERSEFASRGLRIWVVNPEARTWADGRTVTRPGSSDPNDGCNGADCIDP